jgi:hypothetical protein
VVPFYHQRRLLVAKINPSLTVLGDEEGVIIRVCTENPIRIDCVTESPKRRRR